MIPSRGSAAAIAASLLLPPAHCDYGDSSKRNKISFVPYGYQSDSTHSWEYRENSNDDGGSGSGVPSDPSSFVGSVHYDPLHHALYVTGGTYASQVLDGVDVYEVGVEEAEKGDADTANDPYWWDEAGSGLSPHLGDVGVPGWSPAMGDCFYAVLGLPTSREAENAPDKSHAGKVKLVHSRRFGSEGSREACSAVDVLFASPSADDAVDAAAGGYVHEIIDADIAGPVKVLPNDPVPTLVLDEDELTPSPTVTAVPSSSTYEPTITALPSSATYEPTVTAFPTTMSPVKPFGLLEKDVEDFAQGVETLVKEDMAAEVAGHLGVLGENNPTPAPTTYDPTITALPSSSTYEPTVTAIPTTDPPVAPFSTLVNDYEEGAQGVPTLAKGDMAGSSGEKPTLEKLEEDYISRADGEGDPAPVDSTIPRRRLEAERGEAAADEDGIWPRSLALSFGPPPSPDKIATRSVRLLMAGHVESQNYEDGYLVSELTRGQYNEASVYAFAQQVDVRLPAGDQEAGEVRDDLVAYQEGNAEGLGYDLHAVAAEEEGLAQDLDPDWKEDHPQGEFERIVTSGVESRALLNDMLPSEMRTVYPVSLVADPVSKSHYYVAMLASPDGELNEKSYGLYGGDPGDESDGGMEDGVNDDPTVGDGASARSYTDHDSRDDRLIVDGSDDRFGLHGRPDYGSDYRIVLKKMSIETVPASDTSGLDDAELILAGDTMDGEEKVAMRHQWMEEFRPEGGEDARPAGLLYAPGYSGRDDDVLVMVGTTSGRGSAFGTADGFGDESADGTAASSDLDGFVTKVRTDTGAFAGGEKFNAVTGSFLNTHSERIASNPGQDEIVTGVCAKPLRTVGEQDKMEHVYVVGGTTAKLPAIPTGTRDGEFESSFGKTEDGRKVFEAFLMKIDLDTMNVLWTVQVGAVPDPDRPKGAGRRTAFGYGCAVTADGLDVYLTGIVRDGGVATDYSATDSAGLPYAARGGTDVFVSSYGTADGSRKFLQQFGSAADDVPSRGNGGITTDRHGNAVLSGSTRGSLLRRRDEDEFRYGPGPKREAAADVFVMSLERGTGRHVAIGGTDYRPPPPPVPAGYGSPVTPMGTPPTVSGPAPSPAASSSSSSQDGGGGGGIVVLSLLLALVTGALAIFAVFRVHRRRDAEDKALMGSGGNLYGEREANLQARRRSTWGRGNKRSSSASSGLPGVSEMNVMVEVRNSASGGWHGVYDDEQLQAIDFGVPTGSAGGGDVDVVEQSLFMEESGLREIEESLQYEIGEMDDVSDEDLIKAYEDAMALDIEPENPDVEFAMAGLGSDQVDLPSIT